MKEWNYIYTSTSTCMAWYILYLYQRHRLPEGRAYRSEIKTHAQQLRALSRKPACTTAVKTAEQQSVPCACAQGTLVPCFLLPSSSCFLDYNVPCTRGQPTPLERISEFPRRVSLKPGGQHNENGGVGKISSRSFHRRDARRLHPSRCGANQPGKSSEGVCFVGVCYVLLSMYLASYTRCWVRGLLKFKFDEKSKIPRIVCTAARVHFKSLVSRARGLRSEEGGVYHGGNLTWFLSSCPPPLCSPGNSRQALSPPWPSP